MPKVEVHSNVCLLTETVTVPTPSTVWVSVITIGDVVDRLLLPRLVACVLVRELQAAEALVLRLGLDRRLMGGSRPRQCGNQQPVPDTTDVRPMTPRVRGVRTPCPIESSFPTARVARPRLRPAAAGTDVHTPAEHCVPSGPNWRGMLALRSRRRKHR